MTEAKNQTDGCLFNLGTPYGVAREYSRIPCVEHPVSHSLTSHHHYQAENDILGAGVKKGDWLIGERVTTEEATHFLIHSLTVLRKEASA